MNKKVMMTLMFSGMLQWKHILNRDELRWLPGAKNVCFRSFRTSMFFQLGRVIPIVRGEGVYQFGMNFLVEKLNKGGWVQIYPEGKVNMTQEFMRLKWGKVKCSFYSDVSKINEHFLAWFNALRPSQQLWSCRDGQFTQESHLKTRTQHQTNTQWEQQQSMNKQQQNRCIRTNNSLSPWEP